MIHTCSPEEAHRRGRAVDVHGQRYRIDEFVGAAPVRGIYLEGNEANDNLQPQGFLVTQPPGSVTPPHFHESDQFQLFMDGDGHFGKKPVSPLTVQFAAAHTPYGPIRAGAGGVRYYTLRQRWDPGAKYMPQMRDRLVRGRQRQRLATCGEPPGAAVALVVGELMAEEPDGLFARRYRLPPGHSMAGPDPSRGGGQYQVVVAGILRDGGRSYPRLSVRYVSGGAKAPTIVAGECGLDLLVMQFPLHRNDGG